MKALKKITAIINSGKYKLKNKKRIKKNSLFLLIIFFFEILSATVRIPAALTSPIAAAAPVARINFFHFIFFSHNLINTPGFFLSTSKFSKKGLTILALSSSIQP